MSDSLIQYIENNSSFRKDYPLSKINWFQVGGAAQYMFRPKDSKELEEFLKLNKGELPIFTMGVGSNIIIRDGGLKGVVLRLGREFTEMKKISDTEIEVGAACLDVNVSLFAAQNNIAGLEFLSGIPGTIGGAIKMNAGAYLKETKDVLVKAYGYDLNGNYHEFSNADFNYSYRKSNLDKEIIFTKALFKGELGEQEKILKDIEEIKRKREETQPIRSKTGGSTFKNPEGKKAWQLIDEAGCRGYRIGDAVMSEKHCNFMINEGNASAKDLENLGNEVRKKVAEKTGAELEWEIKIIGND